MPLLILYFNPRTPCGVRLTFSDLRNDNYTISIHAPRAGCDCGQAIDWSDEKYFNPRTPCGVRPRAYGRTVDVEVFQSTHPVRGATYGRCGHVRILQISIHAPRAGCDGKHAQLGLLLFLQLHQIGCMLAFIILVLTYNFNRKCDRSRIRRCETPRISMFASASHRVKASAIPPAHRSA